MDSQRFKRISEIAGRVLEREPGEREAALAEEVGDDAELRREVQWLLDAGDGSEGFLEPLTPGEMGGLADRAAAGEQVGRRVGPYVIERPIGSGGMGQVFLASRADGAFDQTVALKLVKRGMDTDRILARFRGERQVLAQLEHPGIARLVDGGATDDGRPYLAMEYVEGEPIDRWCGSRALGTRARLELFLAVCDAVVHAHQRLVVHRDIKPANVLVDGEGRPKLLDFGLAKVLSPSGRSETYDLTAEGERMMTPHYASPEQVRGEPVTTATDVYALGVVLYELLTGRRPYELDGAPWTTVERLVCEQDPPSTGLAADLDTIVTTALRKEPERRYGSVEALAEDLRRYLDGLPIAARPTTVVYRATKFVRRNRLLVGATAAVILALLVAVIGIGRQAEIAEARALEAQAALAESEESLDNAEAVSEFMGRVLLAAGPRDMGQDVTVREAVDAAAAEVDTRLSQRPWVEGSVRHFLGTSYRSLSALPEAVEQLERAVELRAQELGERDPRTLSTRYELALAYRDLGRGVEAEELCVALERAWRARGGERRPELALVLQLRGLLAMEGGAQDVAMAFMRQAAELWDALGGAGTPEAAEVNKHMANVLLNRGEYAEGEALLREVLAAQEQLLGELHPDTLITAVDLATSLHAQGQVDEAELLYRDAFEWFDANLPPGHIDRLATGMQLGYLLTLQERWEEVVELVEPLLAASEQAVGPEHPLTRGLRTDLATANQRLLAETMGG